MLENEKIENMSEREVCALCVCVCVFSGNSEVRSIAWSQRHVKHSLVQNRKHKGIL